MTSLVLNKQYLEKNNFHQIGEYYLINNELKRNYKKYTNELLSKGRKLVYAFIVDDLVMYIGKTKQGFKRPLSYHTDYNNNKKTRGVHKGIREVISKSKIEVFARVFKHEIKVENIEIKINPYVGYEEALINNFTFKWNKQK